MNAGHGAITIAYCCDQGRESFRRAGWIVGIGTIPAIRMEPQATTAAQISDAPLAQINLGQRALDRSRHRPEPPRSSG